MKTGISIIVGILALSILLPFLCSAPVSVLAQERNEVMIGMNILNTAPSMVSIEIKPDDDVFTPCVQVINFDPAKNKTITIIANIIDKNGYDDIANVIAEITGPSIVEGSSLNLTFDGVINITTSTYKGSFNMFNYSEGGYKVEVTATDEGGLTDEGSKNFTYSYSVLQYTIWANSTKHKDAIHWSGSKNVVNGNVHSNNDIKVSGSSNMIIGTTEYVSDFTDSSEKNTFTETPIQVFPKPFPVQYKISDYAPGGPEAIAAENEGKYHYISKNFHSSSSDVVLDGLYYVKGNVKLSGSNISGVFTIVSEENIDVSGSDYNGIAYLNNLLLFSGKEKGEIKISASKSTFCGVIYTEEGEIKMSSSKNTINGALFADTVKLSGSKLNINPNATGDNMIESNYSIQTQITGVKDIIDAIRAIWQIFPVKYDFGIKI
jgi:hypothetical protein